ncbi:MAG: alpha/beta hydrolase [Actinomycetaceae bacterium]|nr:alpha/beta hydrolase [Actinomycetaceae bacterium]
MTRWTEDFLGPGFSQTTLELHGDDEGDVVATLVRYRAEDEFGTSLAGQYVAQPFALLAIHGWNDYFYHQEFARQITALGGHFYAIDLRKYGRSHREGQSWGYMTDLSTYDEDIHAALDVIFHAHGYDIPCVLYGHSTGGLTATLWAERHPGLLAGLILNSPWLEFQGSTLIRQLGQPLLDTVASISPTTVFPLSGNDFYQRLLTGWLDKDEQLTGEMIGDPFYDGGWQPDPRYRHPSSFPIRAGWIAAILRGHAQVAEGLNIDCPVLVMTSNKSILLESWSPQMRGADTVLDVEQIWKRVPTLGHVTTLVRLENAIHDVLLSRASVREEAYDHVGRWLHGYLRA